MQPPWQPRHHVCAKRRVVLGRGTAGVQAAPRPARQPFVTSGNPGTQLQHSIMLRDLPCEGEEPVLSVRWKLQLSRTEVSSLRQLVGQLQHTVLGLRQQLQAFDVSPRAVGVNEGLLLISLPQLTEVDAEKVAEAKAAASCTQPADAHGRLVPAPAQLSHERRSSVDLSRKGGSSQLQAWQEEEVQDIMMPAIINSYAPATIIDTDTPADKLLAMLAGVQNGGLPSPRDIQDLQFAILQQRDIYKPISRLDRQLLQAKTLEETVARNLAKLLGESTDISDVDTQDPPLSSPMPDLGQTHNKWHRVTATTPRIGLVPFSTGSRQVSLDGGSISTKAAVQKLLEGKQGTLDVVIPSPNSHRRSSSNALLQDSPYDRECQAEADTKEFNTPAGTPTSNGSNSSSSRSSTNTNTNTDSSSGAIRPNYTSSTCVSSVSPVAGRQEIAATRAIAASAAAAACIVTSDATAAAAAALSWGPPPPLLDEAERILVSSEGWQWDAFALAGATMGRPLSTLAFYLFQRERLVSHFDIRADVLARFLRRIESGYQDNPYHNATHAADVLQSLAVIIKRGGLAAAYVDPLHMMACFVAAALHDFDHGGLTNDFLISASDPLATIYNDRSPLENHHVAAGFGLLRCPEYNFLESMPKVQRDKFRRFVIELVLATDMKQHFSILSQFNTVHRLATNAKALVKLNSEASDSTSGASARASRALSPCDLVLVDESERLLSLQMALKCADMGHVAAHLSVHCRWVAVLEEEFFLQGDVERANGVPISPLFDRSKQGITKSQVGFFDVLVIPMLKAFSNVFPQCTPQLKYAVANHCHWANAG